MRHSLKELAKTGDEKGPAKAAWLRRDIQDFTAWRTISTAIENVKAGDGSEFDHAIVSAYIVSGGEP